MQYQTEKKNNFHGSNDRVRAHKVCAFIKRYAAVIGKNESIQSTVNDEEGDEKDAGYGHPEFFHQ
jgi:hypothetical protein